MKEKTPHILNASSNLLGFCFFVLVSIKALGIYASTLVDEIVMISILLFVSSSFLSFMSIRSIGRNSERYETYADYIFILGLVSLLIITGFLFFSII